MTITAAADGSALGNPGPAGWAWYIDEDSWDCGGWPHATNNRGELAAVLELLRATRGSAEELLILCDSQYVINCVTKWMPGWKRRGWRKADGGAVLNVDLLEALDAELLGRRFRFEWVRGHTGHPLNEAADARARAAAEAYQRGADVPRGPGFNDAGSGGPGSGGALPVQGAAPAADAATPPQALFDIDVDIDTEPELHELVLTLSRDEYLRLTARARDLGLSPEELVRSRLEG
ncbi:MAG: ribonuclease HI [Microbacteriaceae bacterium]